MLRLVAMLLLSALDEANYNINYTFFESLKYTTG
jgi:hypothetical protein